MRVAITGTPGTGKSRTAGLLAEGLGWNLVDINRLAREKNLYSGYDRKRRCRIVDTDAVAEEVSRIKENVIVEGHLSHDMPCDLVIVLRCGPGELRRRLEARGWPKRKIDENVEAEIMGICREEALDNRQKIVEFDTTGKTAEQVARKILKSLLLK